MKVRNILPQNGNGFEQKSAEKIESFPYYSYFLLKTPIFVRLFIHVIDTERDRTSTYIEPDSTLCVMQKPTLLCSAKTNTTTSGKLGRAVGFSTRASRAGVGF